MKTQSKLVPRMFLAAGALFLTGALFSHAAPVEASPWRVVAASGDVQASPVRGDSRVSWEPLTRGRTLTPMTEVRTGPDGRATLSDGKNIVVVDPDTRVEIPAPASRRAPTRIYQHEGTARYEVTNARKKKFQVVTPYLVAGVKGTVFWVGVDQEKASVFVDEGIVNVSSPVTGQDMDLVAGDEARIDAMDGAAIDRIEQGRMAEIARHSGLVGRRLAMEMGDRSDRHHRADEKLAGDRLDVDGVDFDRDDADRRSLLDDEDLGRESFKDTVNDILDDEEDEGDGSGIGGGVGGGKYQLPKGNGRGTGAPSTPGSTSPDGN